MIVTLLQDIRFGFRLLFKNPGFTAVAALSLALGIGANATIFSFINAILLRPLPVKEPEQLVRVYTSSNSIRFGAVSHQDYLDLREGSGDVLSGLTAERLKPMSISDGGQNEIIPGCIVSGNYFSLLGVSPAAGRAFLPDEDETPGARAVAVISYGLWRRRFNADPAAVGQTVTINNHAFTIVGVAPEKFTGIALGQAPEVWVPLMMQPQAVPGATLINSRDMRWLNVTGRLKPGVSPEQAQARIDALARRIAEENPRSNAGTWASVFTVNDNPDGPRKAVVPVLGVLAVVVGLILLIACANIANLLLARATARRKEIAIRLSLGASRARLVRQLLTESVLLSLGGGVVGLLASVWAPGLLFASLKPPTAFGVTLDLGVDGRVLFFTLGLSVVTSLIFGLAPALRASKLDLTSVLKDEAGALGGGVNKSRLRAALVIAQVTLSLVLLIGAGLFVRSLRSAQSVSTGFDGSRILNASFNVALQGYNQARGEVFERQVLEQVRALPGVEAASLAEVLPLSGSNQQLLMEAEGYEPVRPGDTLSIDYNVVATDYFKTMGIGFARGRDFESQDREGSPGVVVVNEAMARRLWPGQNPVGKWLRPAAPNAKNLEVIGVVANGKYRRLNEEPLSYMYLPLAQNYSPGVTLQVRTGGEPHKAAESLRRAIQSLDGSLAIYNVKTMDESVGLSLFDQRLAATLLSFFGLLALVLAGVGLYGVMNYAVSQRTRELGIRMALGAQKGNIIRLVVGQGLKLTLVGTGIGLVVAFALTRLISRMLYGIGAGDPVTFAGTSLLLLTVAFVASYIPARRATRVNPMVALRSQ